MTRLGVAALGCYSIHGGFHLLHGRPEDLLWACHLGALLVGVGLLARSASVNAVGTLWLCLGTPLWLLDLAGGGEFNPTSCFTHLGGLALGLYAVRLLGVPQGAWWKAEVALIALIAGCRVVTPARANVNVAFAVHPGWEGYFASHPAYLVTMLSLAAGYFLVMAGLIRRLTPKSAREQP